MLYILCSIKKQELDQDPDPRQKPTKPDPDNPEHGFDMSSEVKPARTKNYLQGKTPGDQNVGFFWGPF